MFFFSFSDGVISNAVIFSSGIFDIIWNIYICFITIPGTLSYGGVIA